MAEKKNSRDITVADASVGKGTPLRRSTRLSSASAPAAQLEMESSPPKKKVTEATIGVRRSRRLSQSQLATPDGKSERKVATRRASTNEFSTPKVASRTRSESESTSKPMPRRCASESPTAKRSAPSSRTPEGDKANTRRSTRLSTGRSPIPVKQLWTPKVRKNLESVSEDPSELTAVNLPSPSAKKTSDHMEPPEVSKFNGNDLGITPIHKHSVENNRLSSKTQLSKHENSQCDVRPQDKQNDSILSPMFNKQTEKCNQLTTIDKTLDENDQISSEAQQSKHATSQSDVNTEDKPNDSKLNGIFNEKSENRLSKILDEGSCAQSEEIMTIKNTPKSQQVKSKINRTPSDQCIQKPSQFDNTEANDDDKKLKMICDRDSVMVKNNDSNVPVLIQSEETCSPAKSGVYMSPEQAESPDSISLNEGDNWLCLTIEEDEQKEKPHSKPGGSWQSANCEKDASISSSPMVSTHPAKEEAKTVNVLQEHQTVDNFKVEDNRNSDDEKENNSLSTNVHNGVVAKSLTKESLINKSPLTNTDHKNSFKSPVSYISSARYATSSSAVTDLCNAADDRDDPSHKSDVLNGCGDNSTHNRDEDHTEIADIPSSRTSGNCNVSMASINGNNSNGDDDDNDDDDDDDRFSEGLSCSSDVVRSPAINKSLKYTCSVSKTRELQENNAQVKSTLPQSPLVKDKSNKIVTPVKNKGCSPPAGNPTSSDCDLDSSSCSEDTGPADSLELQQSPKPHAINTDCTGNHRNGVDTPEKNNLHISTESSTPDCQTHGDTSLETEANCSKCDSDIETSEHSSQRDSRKQTKQSKVELGKHPSESYANLDISITNSTQNENASADKLDCSMPKSPSGSEKTHISTGYKLSPEKQSVKTKLDGTVSAGQLDTDNIVQFNYNIDVNIESPKPTDNIEKSKQGSKRKLSETTERTSKKIFKQLTEDEDSLPRKIIKLTKDSDMIDVKLANSPSSGHANKNISTPVRESPTVNPTRDSSCTSSEGKNGHKHTIQEVETSPHMNNKATMSEETPKKVSLNNAKVPEDEKTPSLEKDESTAESNSDSCNTKSSSRKKKRASSDRSNNCSEDINNKTKTPDSDGKHLKESSKLSKELGDKLDRHVAQYLRAQSVEMQKRQQDANNDSDDSEVDDAEGRRFSGGTEYIDDMAEEAEEDSEVDDSNDIPEEGESVGYSSEDIDPDESYEKNSFIDDEDYALLSGNEDEITVEGQSDGHSRTEPLSTSDKKWSRIIQVESSSEEETDGAAVSDASTKVLVGSCRKETNTQQPETCTDIPDVEVAGELLTSTPQRPMKTSITVQENISVKEIQDESLRMKINDVVGKFHKRNSHQGEVTLNVSVNYSIALPTERATDPGSGQEVFLPVSEQPDQLTSSSSSGERKKRRKRNRKRKWNGPSVQSELRRESPSGDKYVNEAASGYQNDGTKERIEDECLASEDDQQPSPKKVKTQFNKGRVQRLKGKPVVENLLLQPQKQIKKQKVMDATKSFADRAATKVTEYDNTSTGYRRKQRKIKASTSNADSMWQTEVVNAKPSGSNNRPVCAGASTAGSAPAPAALGQQEFHPKDFRSRMLYNNKRVQRVAANAALKRK